MGDFKGIEELPEATGSESELQEDDISEKLITASNNDSSKHNGQSEQDGTPVAKQDESVRRRKTCVCVQGNLASPQGYTVSDSVSPSKKRDLKRRICSVLLVPIAKLLELVYKSRNNTMPRLSPVRPISPHDNDHAMPTLEREDVSE